MIQHPKLRTVRNIKDLEIGTCIPALYHAYRIIKNTGHIFNIGGDFDIPPTTNFTNNYNDVRAFFLIMIGYDRDGNKILIADRPLMCSLSWIYIHYVGKIGRISNEELAAYDIVTPYNLSTEDDLDRSKFKYFESSASYSIAYNLRKDTDYGWISSSGSSERYVGVEFLDSPKIINGFNISKFSGDSGRYNFDEFKFQGANDDNEWVDLYHFLRKGINGIYRIEGYSEAFIFNNNTPYSKYRFIQRTTDLNSQFALGKFELYTKRTDDTDIKDYNFKIDLPSLYIMNNLKYINFGEDIDPYRDIIITTKNTDNYDWLKNYESTNVRLWRHETIEEKYIGNIINRHSGSEDRYIYYRPLLVCEPKSGKGEIYSSSISTNNIDDTVDKIDINIKLNDEYIIPVDIRVYINKKLISDYNRESSDKNISLEIFKRYLSIGDNIINVHIISKENKWLRSFNSLISYHPDGSQPLQSKDFVYSEEVDHKKLERLDSGYGKPEVIKENLKVEFNTKNKSSITKIRLKNINDIKNIRILKLKNPGVKVVDEKIKKFIFEKISTLESIESLNINRKKR